MFTNASMHVLPFDSRFGADHARQYASKYASKPEKWHHVPELTASQNLQQLDVLLCRGFRCDGRGI